MAGVKKLGYGDEKIRELIRGLYEEIGWKPVRYNTCITPFRTTEIPFFYPKIKTFISINSIIVI